MASKKAGRQTAEMTHEELAVRYALSKYARFHRISMLVAVILATVIVVALRKGG